MGRVETFARDDITVNPMISFCSFQDVLTKFTSASICDPNKHIL